MADGSWRIWIDTGGTFTDCVAVDPAGRIHRAKVLSSGGLRGRVIERAGERKLRVEQRWGAGDDFCAGFGFHRLGAGEPAVAVTGFDAAASVLELAAAPPAAPPGTAFELDAGVEAPILAARLVTGRRGDLPAIDMRLATTRGTNALLERRGAPTALFITRGFGDLLLIGDQQRPDLFALRIVKPDPVHGAVVEVDERLAADGSVITAIDLDAAVAAGERLLGAGIRSAAVALLHGYRNPDHERRLAARLRDLGFDHVSCSGELAPLIKIVPRAETAVVNAYLAPVLESYLDEVASAIGGGRLHVMTSAGGLVAARSCRAKDGLLSGPAGGVAGAAESAARSGLRRVIGFDMGGTSTDVARYDGEHEYVFEQRVGGVRLAAPSLAIETVAAGGGSICAFVDGALRVGPRSAGARPGPACYGAGGPLTLTDVNLLLGRLDHGRFGIPVSAEPAEAELARVRAAVAEGGGGAEPDDLALLEGFLEIANQRMADAIGEVSLRRGYDPAEYALVAFGGAGGQHACAVADHLGVETILMPADASLLSALGLGHALVERFAERQVLRRLGDVASELGGWIDELGRRAAAQVGAEGVDAGEVVVRRRIINLRLVGQESALAVEAGDDLDVAELQAVFARRYEAVYGHAPQGAVEVESIRVAASSRPGPRPGMPTAPPPFAARSARTLRACFGGVWRTGVPAHERSDLGPGAEVDGPALVFDDHSTYVIEPSWRGAVDAAGALVLRKRRADARAPAPPRPEVVAQELFTNRLLSVARQMGRMLQRTSLSTNVKERLDFSCALLDGGGELVVHAPHMPVHLGALGLCTRTVRDAVAMAPGDVVITNHPAFGGSHLPDVTLITPVHHGGALVGYVASRAHHAEIGGVRPGSMPPLARRLAEEGVVIDPVLLVDGGEARFDRLRAILAGGPYPSRAVEDNLADVRAQLAANHHGAAALAELAAAYGPAVVAERMDALKGRAEALAREALRSLPNETCGAEERLDDGSPIRVAIDLRGPRAVFDFAGSAGVHPGNLNAPRAVVHSAVIYVLRLLIGESLPLNEGIMRAVQVRLEPGMLDPPFGPDPAAAPAVGGGNVETSQRIVDTLLKAFGVVACSQGTMNNILFGTERFSYYETVCGGSGAGLDFDGADAVHTHMTNTRITDPEILEHRYPVRLERFAIRRGSGGAGRRRGGDGVVREITFLEPMSLSILTQHRTAGPYGLDGGEPGAPGAQHLVRADGSTQPLDPIDGTDVARGDRLVMRTPGGGGCGRNDQRSAISGSAMTSC